MWTSSSQRAFDMDFCQLEGFVCGLPVARGFYMWTFGSQRVLYVDFPSTTEPDLRFRADSVFSKEIVYQALWVS